jgi:hypothetical protein
MSSGKNNENSFNEIDGICKEFLEWTCQKEKTKEKKSGLASP